ncbi:MAG: glycosyl hydrolase, partial [Cytophagales bacterium]|nr:glycosyl hydrolase [Cytophagales bacterium]
MFLLPCFILLSVATEKNGPDRDRAMFAARQKHWVDSVYNGLTPDERIGQLFMVAAYSDANPAQVSGVEGLIGKYHVGGLIFFQGSPARQAHLTNHYQSLARVPLMIGMDAEWGLGMRLDSTISFPRQMTLGAIQNNESIYRMGTEVARQCARLGVHLNFAPVVDINSNPNNPVIGARSFGEDKENVALKGVAYMRGLQDHGVLASAKHFPGHGDTDADSHATLPQVGHNKNRLEETELYPFRKLFADSLQSVLVAHLAVPAYEKSKNLPSTLSRNIVTDLLQKQMGFGGLVFTDALNMKGVTKSYKPGEIEVMALQAGNDVLLFSEDVPEAVARIKKALKGRQL